MIVYTNLVLTSAVFLIFVFLIRYALTFIEAYRYKRDNGCKSAKPYPQIHGLFGLDKVIDMRKNAQEQRFLEIGMKKAQAFDHGTYSVSVVGSQTTMTVDPENVKAILTSKFQDFGLGIRKVAFGPLLGQGMFNADGRQWEHSRAMARPVFNRSNIANLQHFEGHIQHLIGKIPTDGSTVDLQPLFFNLTLDTGTEFLLGQSVNSQTAKPGSRESEFTEEFDYAQLQLQRRTTMGPALPIYWNPKFNRACKVVHEFIDEFVQETIEARKSALEDPEKVPNPDRYVYLSELSKKTLEPIILRDELLNVLLAARDTTAGLLTNTFHALARHPSVWAKLKAEVDLLGGTPPDYQTLRKMEYVKQLVNEVLRLWPSAPSNVRCAIRNTCLPRGGGPDGKSPIFIPAGSQVIWSYYAMHRRTETYGPDAELFRPERWARDALNPLQPGFAYLPFGGGPRTCIGQQYAWTETSYTIVRIIQQFGEIESRDPRPWTELLGVTLASAHGTQVALTPR